jgi:hypothetical protein
MVAVNFKHLQYEEVRNARHSFCGIPFRGKTEGIAFFD